ncbi:MAG: hypothetical protein R3315_13140, partial [Woeseiaceae bacterium]|nr:hypothetical protein [Woeseiaceae bacterium]
MNAETEKIQTELADQLSNFEERLDDRTDDLALITGIRDAVERLLDASGGNEAQIRRVLQERYDSGKLRKETFQLVKSMLDGYTPAAQRSANPQSAVRTTDSPAPAPAGKKGAFTSTVVLPSDTAVLAEGSADERVQVGSVLRDRFLLQERITGGGMGVVYKAMDRRLAEAGDENPWVAIKVLSPQLAANGHALRA